MARNLIQFQPGLSLLAFLELYGSETQCREALLKLRWPKGFVCSACDNTTGCLLSRGVYQCHRCHHQASLTANTIFHATHLPLTTWFLAIYLLTQRKNGLSALQLSRELGISYNTAWKLKHKILQVMLERNQGKRLSGRIEIDDAYLGGERSGKRGRGATHKFPFVAAVATNEQRHPLQIQLRRVRSFTRAELTRFATSSVVNGSHVVSDGLACFKAFDDAHYRHERHVIGGGSTSGKHPAFKWVNTLLGNVKNAITGTYHAIRGQHTPRYLAEFEYRFNRRYDLGAMIPRFLVAALKAPPMPYRVLRLAEQYA